MQWILGTNKLALHELSQVGYYSHIHLESTRELLLELYAIVQKRSLTHVGKLK